MEEEQENYNYFLVMDMRETPVIGEDELTHAKKIVVNNPSMLELQARFNGGWLVYNPTTDTFD